MFPHRSINVDIQRALDECTPQYYKAFTEHYSGIYNNVRWNLSKPDTIGKFISVLYKEVSLFRDL